MLRHFKLNNKEIRSHLQGLRPFKYLLPKNIKKILNKKNDIFYEILGKWLFIVGSKISLVSRPKSITFSKNNEKKSLTLLINKGSEVDIEYSKNIIINKINSYFGYNLINEIILKTASHKQKKMKQAINKLDIKKLIKLGNKVKNIKNDKIKLSLEKLVDQLKKNAQKF